MISTIEIPRAPISRLVDSGKGLPPGYPQQFSQLIGEFTEVMRNILIDGVSPDSPELCSKVSNMLSKCGNNASMLASYCCRHIDGRYHPLFKTN